MLMLRLAVRAADLFWLIVFGPLAICFVLKTLLRPQMDWSWNFKMIKNIICRGKISLSIYMYMYVYLCMYFAPDLWSWIFTWAPQTTPLVETGGQRRTDAEFNWIYVNYLNVWSHVWDLLNEITHPPLKKKKSGRRHSVCSEERCSTNLSVFTLDRLRDRG